MVAKYCLFERKPLLIREREKTHQIISCSSVDIDNNIQKKMAKARKQYSDIDEILDLVLEENDAETLVVIF